MQPEIPPVDSFNFPHGVLRGLLIANVVVHGVLALEGVELLLEKPGEQCLDDGHVQLSHLPRDGL